ncbi:MAG: hypothetical protein AAF582_05220 [Pseudomonadota bacterium]
MNNNLWYKIEEILGPHARLVFAFIIVAFVVRLFFWAYTNRVWEDALITVLHAEYLFERGSLSHLRLDDQVVHGFTSPISVLIPILGGALDFKGTYALEFMKLVSAIGGSVTVYLAHITAKETSTQNMLAWLILSLGYITFEHHQMLWGMAGMETQLVTASVFFAFYACAKKDWRLCAFALAATLYARPDFAFLNVIITLYLFFTVGRVEAIKAVALGAVLYSPWLIFTTAYYGSPIPNTVFAKGFGYGSPDLNATRKLLDFWVPLGPSFAGHGSGYWRLWDSGFISLIMAGLFGFGAYRVFVRRIASMYVPVLFVLVYWFYYVFAVAGVFGWYVVPISAATIFVAGYGLISLFESRVRIGQGGAGLHLAAIVTVLPVSIQAERDIQMHIEEPVRTAFGKYMNSVMREEDRVGMEPLGYSSYYSRRVIIDYPGLINPDVVEYTRAAGPVGLCEVLDKFRPEFIALRAYECAEDEWLEEHYVFLRSFFALPGAEDTFLFRHNIDTYFGVFKRSDVPFVPVPLIEDDPRALGLRDPQIDQVAPIALNASLNLFGEEFEGDFERNGHNAQEVGELVPGPVFGSHRAAGDQGVGSIRYRFVVPDGTKSIAVPIVTGPGGESAQFTIFDDSGAILQELRGAPGLGQWRLWKVRIPENDLPSEYQIEVRDNGSGWGEWVAVGGPFSVLD